MVKKKLYDENGKEVQVRLKKPFYKRVSFWIVFVIVSYIFSVFSGSEESPEQAEVDAGAEPKVEDVVQVESFKTGDVVTVGDMEYVVNGVETATSIGSDLLNIEANDTFLIVDLTVKNNGNEAVMVDTSFFKLADGEKTFEADTTGSMYANEGATTFFLKSLNPDVELGGRIVFDVSEAQANSGTVKLKASTGLFGTETEVINLR